MQLSRSHKYKLCLVLRLDAAGFIIHKTFPGSRLRLIASNNNILRRPESQMDVRSSQTAKGTIQPRYFTLRYTSVIPSDVRPSVHARGLRRVYALRADGAGDPAGGHYVR